jgi:hypothetical protein
VARNKLKKARPVGRRRLGPCFESICSSLKRVVNLGSATDWDPGERFACLGIYGIKEICWRRRIEFVGDIVL